MTLPRQPERSGHETHRRLAEFRRELRATGDAPTPAIADRLALRARELGLRDEDVSEDLTELRARADALALKSQLARGDMPVAEPLDSLPAGDRCHFLCPARFGRRRADQVGHLVLLNTRLQFRGALDVSVVWTEVSAVQREGRDIIVSLQDSRRVLRFSCQSMREAVEGGVIAEYLASADAPSPRPQYHASI
jgi:hypothetical protein